MGICLSVTCWCFKFVSDVGKDTIGFLKKCLTDLRSASFCNPQVHVYLCNSHRNNIKTLLGFNISNRIALESTQARKTAVTTPPL